MANVLEESVFFEKALDVINKLDELIIVSQTPYMLNGNRDQLPSKYIDSLQQRFDDDTKITKYYVANTHFIKNFFSLSTHLTYKMKEKIHIVDDRYFPLASMWIGKSGETITRTMIKLKTIEDNNILKSLWIEIESGIHDLNKILDPLKNNSKSINKFLDLMKNDANSKEISGM